MDAIPAAAFLVRRTGAFEHANALGMALLGRGGDVEPRLTAAVQALGLGDRLQEPFSVTPAGQHAFLVVQATSSETPSQLVERAARTWGLTRQQTKVLSLLVDGEPNKGIAARFRCSVRTVELHVSAILAKAKVGSRVGVLARLREMERGGGRPGIGAVAGQ